MVGVAVLARLLLAIGIALVMFIALSFAAYYVAWYFFGLTGHPPTPAVPWSAYVTYAVSAPLLCLGTAAWLVFRRTTRNERS